MALKKRNVVLVAFVAAVFGNPVFAQDWIVFAPAGGGYRVELPGAPKVMTREVPTQIGQIKTTMAFVERGSVAFIVSYNDYPESAQATPPEQLLDGVRNGQVGTNKLRTEERIQISGRPGRQLIIDAAQGKVVVSRIVLVQTRLFQAVYVGPTGSEDSNDAKRFLASFMLVN